MYWAAAVAIAALLQVALLLANAIFVLRYLVETRKLRKASEDQVRESQNLVAAAQKQLEVSQAQVAASQAQVEAQIRPTIAIRMYGGVRLVNVGSGAALNLKIITILPGAPVAW